LDQHSAYPLIFGDLEKIESVMAANLTDHAWSVAELLKFKNKNLTVKLDHQPNM
jgi:hypothetical protein